MTRFSCSCLLLLILVPAAEARRFVRPAPPPPEPSVVEQVFGGSPAFRLELAPIRGELHRAPGPTRRWLDFADYSEAGRLVVAQPLSLGPLAAGPATVPPGEYRLSLSVAGPEGLPVLSLTSAAGLRLRIPMVAAPRPPERPEVLQVTALGAGEQAEVSLPLAIHMPTVSGLIVLGPLDPLAGENPKRRRSRTALIEEEMQRRALESGHVRSMKRRESRD